MGTSLGRQHWEKPLEGWVKLNVDTTLFEDISCTGLGSVARDAAGKFFRARNMRHEGLVSPREAEAMELKEALSWVKASNFKKCIFETDSQILAEACKGTRRRSHPETIVSKFQHFDDVLVDFVRRSTNEVAHLLARAARSVSDFREWHENAPDTIYHVLISESF